MNTTCKRARRLLSQRADGPLDTVDQERLGDHLATCAACRAFERDLRAGLAGIGRLPRLVGSERVRATVLAGVHPGGPSAWPAGWHGWAGQGVKLAGALAAFALVAVVLMTVFGGSEPNQRGTGGASEPTTTPGAALTAEPTSEATPAGNRPQPCVDGQVAFDIAVEDSPGDPAINSPGFVGITVTALKSTGGVECRLATPVSLAITGADGMPLDIAGSPATATLDAVLGAGEASVSFAWFNWCGAPGPFSLEIEMQTSPGSGSGMGQSLDVTPPCDDMDQPSKLGQAAMAQTVPTDGTCQTIKVVMTSSDLQREEDDVLIWVVATNLAGCGEGEVVAVTLTDESGERLAVDGNGADLMLKADESGEYAWAGLAWSNWCGGGTGFNLTVAGVDDTSAWAHVVPGCQDASQPSQMTPTEIAPPDEVWPRSGAVGPGLPAIDDLAACDLSTSALALTLFPTHGDIIIGFDAGVGAGEMAAPCVLTGGELAVTITGPDGQPLTLDGNGATLDLGGDGLTRVLPLAGLAQLVWENWCGASGPFTVTATLDGRTTTTQIDSPPDCKDVTVPSTLRFLTGPMGIKEVEIEATMTTP